jgi:threonine dehydrogenase-like Zn-dependent dehydrogenase
VREQYAACETTNDGPARRCRNASTSRHRQRCSATAEDGALQSDIIISHRMKLADAARGYEMFEEKQDDCRKVVLTP